MQSLRLALPFLALAFASLAHGAVKNVVLVHGAFADGSGWKRSGPCVLVGHSYGGMPSRK
jgi:hypothetical protein